MCLHLVRYHGVLAPLAVAIPPPSPQGAPSRYVGYQKVTIYGDTDGGGGTTRDLEGE